MMIGVTQGYTVSLELEGIGYQAKIEKAQAVEKAERETSKNQDKTETNNRQEQYIKK